MLGLPSLMTSCVAVPCLHMTEIIPGTLHNQHLQRCWTLPAGADPQRAR